MSCACKANPAIRVGDYGVAFVFEVLDAGSLGECESPCDAEPVDVSAGVFTVIFTDPQGNSTTFVAPDVTLSTDGTDGRFQVVVPAGLFDVAGPWRRQARVVVSGKRWTSPIECFDVLPNLD